MSMRCCGQCAGIEQEFNAAVASRELARYRRHGASGTTRILIETLRSEGVAGLALLDIGGGIGAIQHELVRAGAAHVTSVDASSAYLQAQQDEAARLGYAGRATHTAGDFVTLALQIPDADIVTLDRVICCYHDMRALVGLSAARARRLYGLVYPRATFWNRVGILLINLIQRLRRRSFRTFLHHPSDVDALIRGHGFRPRFERLSLLWHVAVYAR